MTLHLHYSHRFFLYELRICVIRTGVVRATKASRHPSSCYFTLNLDSSAKLDELDGCESCSMRMPDDHGMESFSVREYGTCSSHDCMIACSLWQRPGDFSPWFLVSCVASGLFCSRAWMPSPGNHHYIQCSSVFHKDFHSQ